MQLNLDTGKYNVVIDSSNFDVNIGESARIDVGQAVTYIKSGEKEIETYVETVSKPSINNYINEYAAPIVSNVVYNIAQDLVLDYVDNTIKPNLDDYSEQKTNEYNNNATILIAAYNQNASTLLTEFNTNATEKTNSFNTLAADKTNLVNTYVNEAKGYRDNTLTYSNNAKTSETNAKTSESNALSYKNSASSSASTATSQANIATTKASEAAVSAARAENATSNKANLNLGNSTAITNCITEIPQDIKLELNNGTLTLKAGSKVYVPNGVNRFDEVIIASDVSATRKDNQDCMAWYNANIGTMQLFPTILFYSGSTAPSGQQFMFWYDTTNNKCKVTSDSGSTWVEGKSFPLCVVSTDGNQISSIDQTFNGFGYIGSTIFALPGVKGLIPNGRNADGTLKNLEVETTKVSTISINTPRADTYITLKSNGVISISSILSSGLAYYDEEKNLFHQNANDKGGETCAVGLFNCSATGVDKFIAKKTFRAVDYNDVEALATSVFDNKLKVVSALPSNPDSAVFYYIPE